MNEQFRKALLKPNRCKCEWSMLLLAFAGRIACPFLSQAAEPTTVSSSYENRIVVDLTSSAQSLSISIFGGIIGPAGNANTPNNGSLYLERAAFGYPVAATLNVPNCAEGIDYLNWALRRFNPNSVADPGQAFSIWGPKADPDHDGRDNLMEWALGSDPLIPDAADSIHLEVPGQGGTNQLYVSFERQISPTEIDYFPAVSGDLINWYGDPAHLDYLGATSAGAGYERVQYRDATLGMPGKARFFKLVVRDRYADPPEISLTSPKNLSYFTFGEMVQLSADAFDLQGCIQAVEFYANGRLIGSLSGSPLDLIWTPTNPVNYSITARVIDQMGNVADSAPRTIFLNFRPTIAGVTFSSPANFHTEGPIFAAPQSTDADHDMIFHQLCFALDVLVPYQLPLPLRWQPQAPDAGAKRLTIKARDTHGAVGQLDRDVYVFRTPPRP